MAVRTVLVCEAQVPLVSGGAEILVRQLTAQLRSRGFDADLVSLPFAWRPKEEILASAAAWRLLNLEECNGRAIDRVIATKFPTYFVRHPNKVVWLVHQHRAAYELCDTPYSDFGHTERDVGLRDRLIRLDGEMLGESRRIFTIAKNVAARLAQYNGLRARALYHPPKLAGRLRAGPYGDFVLSVGRLETIKRVELAVRAIARAGPSIRLIVAGDGSQREALMRAAEKLGAADRTTFAGAVDDETLIDLYANALGVIYAPFDEDLGYVTLEAFLSRKPIITAVDSGGTLEFVIDGVNGLIVDPDADAMAQAIARLAADRALAARLGDAGYDYARTITWDGVIEALVE
jgi:glycosyltransferase involved in cell wall biosynthesis